MKYRLLFLLSFLLLSFNNTILPSSAQEQSNPYIYYYTNILDAIVIERADGTDSRVLIDGLSYDHHENFNWSNSGEWLMWRAWSYSGLHKQFLVRTDGNDEVILPDDVGIVYRTQWARHHDYLLLVYSSAQNPYTFGIMIFDPEQRQALSSFTFQEVIDESIINTNFIEHISFLGNLSQDYWAEDDQSIAFRIINSPYEKILYMDIYGNLRLYSEISGLVWHWTGNGRLIHQRSARDTPIIEDLFNGQQFELSEPLVQDLRMRTSWSPDEEYGVFLSSPIETQDSNTSPQTLFFNWQTGMIRTLSGNFVTLHSWSPTGEVFLLKDVNNQIYVVNVNDLMPNATSIFIPEHEHFELDNLIWVDDTIFIAYEAEENRLTWFDTSSNTVLQTANVVPQSTMLSQWDSVVFSPNFTYASYQYQNWYWTDLSNNDLLEFGKNEADVTIRVAYSLWSSDENWIFIVEAGQVEAIVPQILSIRSRDESVYRILGKSGSMGFVPEYVLPYLQSGTEVSVLPVQR